MTATREWVFSAHSLALKKKKKSVEFCISKAEHLMVPVATTTVDVCNVYKSTDMYLVAFILTQKSTVFLSNKVAQMSVST